jgi:hypothetical protein
MMHLLLQQVWTRTLEIKFLKEMEPKRKPVFKYVLGAPYSYKWPTVKNEHAIMDQLLQLLCDPKDDVIMGISKTTEHLESSSDAPGLLFLCKDDIKVSQIYSHLPSYLFLKHPKAFLIPLSVGSEKILSSALKKDALMCIYVLQTAVHFDPLYSLVTQNTDPVSIPWLKPSKQLHYVPPNFRTIATTALIIDKKRPRKDEKKDETLPDQPKPFKPRQLKK